MKFKVIITGSTGMVGKGVLLECLDHAAVESILLLNRRSVEIKHDKITEIIVKDFFDLEPHKDKLKGYDACFFCLGISAFRMSEKDYTRITHDLTLNVANTLLELNPNMTFCYVSGQGTDSSEKGRQMWARVKGKTENDLLKMSFPHAYMFRPGFIQPMKEVKSSTKMYNAIYAVFSPLYPILKRTFPNQTTTSENVGKAMINILFTGIDKKHLDNADINRLAAEEYSSTK